MRLAIRFAHDAALFEVAEEDHLSHQCFGLRLVKPVLNQVLDHFAKVRQKTLIDPSYRRKPVRKEVLLKPET